MVVRSAASARSAGAAGKHDHERWRRAFVAPRNTPIRVFARKHGNRFAERLDEALEKTMLALVAGLSDGRFAWLRFLPSSPFDRLRWKRVPQWPVPASNATPPTLQSYAGVLRDREEEQRCYEDVGPLQEFLRVHAEAAMWSLKHSASFLVPTYPALRRAFKARERVQARPTAPRSREHPPAELARLIRAEAKRLGLSEVGFAKADVKYTFAGHPDPGDANVIVCISEQDWAATQTIPSAKAERAAFRSYGQLHTRTAELAAFVKSLGYDARPHELGEGAISINYAVEAGLGQLGLNGQLLTPVAGSRCRLALITTDAPVELGTPADYGIPSLCDACQLCVRRCPPGAIPLKRTTKRGIVKAPIKPERCYPVIATTHGCAICMKVCPIQRYGLEAVTDHYVATGQILGKGTDELEGYLWPHDGRFYGSGEKPRMTSDVLKPPGWVLDPTRTAPLDPERSMFDPVSPKPLQG